ncbi:MAG: DUF2007 domain-containing protein [Candidatus Aadella gelida]|nr:DUF2007 domain-containing protein [Candidatus Aadella gelida]
MKKCPKCNEGLPDYADTCPDCFVDLDTGEKLKKDQAVTKEQDFKPEEEIRISEKLVPIKMVLNEHEAYIIVGLLESNDIRAVLSKDDCGGMRSHLTYLTGGIKVMVGEKDAERALEILTEFQKDNNQHEKT